MKRKIHLSTKQLIFSSIVFLLFSAITVTLFSYKRDEKRFIHITSALFEEEMTANTLNMHYTIAYPQDFGICQYKPLLPVYKVTSEDTSQASSVLNQLHSLNRERLTDKNQYTYTLLERTLTLSKTMESFPYFEEPLSPACGMQTQLPILLTDYLFRNKQDVRDYLSLLDQTDEYFSSLLTFEKEKAKKGLLMSTSSLQKVRSQCDLILTKKALEQGDHFLQTSFSERLLALSKKETLTKEEARYFVSQNERLLKTVVLPAYEALSDGILLLEASAKDPLPKGLASYPNGKSYYACLLTAQTGSTLTPDQAKELLSQQLTKDYEKIQLVISQNPQCKEVISSQEYASFPGWKPGTMIADLEERMALDFPNYPNASHRPTTTIKNVSPSLSDYCAPAFYLTSPIDDTDNNVIYINKKSNDSDLETYTTLAHEGYPGHLYQNVYSNQYLLMNKENKIRQLLWYGGYLEGWALYVEFLSFDYASKLWEEQNRPQDAVCVQLEKHNRSLQLCLYSLLDIMIHYENTSREETTKLLSSFGISNPETANSIYSYIAENPCNYLKYYLGYLEILQVKEMAIKQWGSSYSDKAFHTFYLQCGPSDFCSLKEKLQETKVPPS